MSRPTIRNTTVGVLSWMLLAAGLVSFATVAADRSEAHGGFFWITDLWDEQDTQVYPHGEIDYRFGAQTAPLNTQTWRTTVRAGIPPWDNADTDDPKFVKRKNKPATQWSFDSCSLQQDLMFFSRYWFQPFESGIAVEHECTHPTEGHVTRSNVSFFVNSVHTWNIDQGAPLPNALDLLGAATHEIGHAFGWGPHWDDGGFPTDPAQCPGNSADATMCKFFDPGQTYIRSLGIHDVHTAQNGY